MLYQTLWWFHIVTLIFLSCLASAVQQSKIRGCLDNGLVWRKVAKKGTFLKATILLINIWSCFKQFYHFQHHIWNVSFQHCQQKFLTAVKHATNSPICLYLRVDARYLELYLHFHDFFSDARSIFRKKTFCTPVAPDLNTLEISFWIVSQSMLQLCQKS